VRNALHRSEVSFHLEPWHVAYGVSLMALNDMRLAISDKRERCRVGLRPRLAGVCAAIALMLVAIGAAAAASAGEEARGETHVPAASPNSTPSPDSLLGALSFTANHEPISVTADAMEFDYRSRVLTYEGNVEVTQGDMRLESTRLTVTLDEHPDNRIKEVVADGQVRLSNGTRWATGGHAVFDQAHNTVVLSGNADLHDGPNQVTGDRVVVYLDEKRSVVEGGKGRVTAKLFPPQGTVTPAGGRAP